MLTFKVLTYPETETLSFMGSGESCTTQTPTVSPVTITSRDEFLRQRS